MKFYKYILTAIFSLTNIIVYAQNSGIRTLSELTNSVEIETHSTLYHQAYLEMANMLDGKAALSIKRAVFLLEWAFLDGKLDYDKYCDEISHTSHSILKFMKMNGLEKHPIGGNMALFEFFTNPSPLNSNQAYTYDFEDFWGRQDYTKMFVTKLMATHSGQCRSLPLLYKILSDEIGAESYIAYAPNHSFIRHKSEDGSRYMCIELPTIRCPERYS